MKNKARHIIDEREYAVEFVTSSNSENEAFFAYLLMPKMAVAAFRELLKNMPVNLRHFGVVLATGRGHNPSAAVKKEILSKFPNAVL